MRLDEFIHSVNKVGVYFNLSKDIPQAAKASWFERVKHINPAALPFIEKAVCDEHDRFPANLPRAYRQAFEKWSKEHPQPEKAVRGCANCEGGILFLERVRPDGSIETGSCLCASCCPGDPGRIGKAFLAEMENLGWRSAKLAATDKGKAKAAGVRERLFRARREWARPDPRRTDYFEQEEVERW